MTPNSSFKTVSVVGLGYIGLPTAAMFASRRVQVIGVDINQHAIDTINQGRIHIVEPELDMIVHSTVTEGFLRATSKPEPADAFLIAVPTPFKANHEPDLCHVEAAARSIAPVLRPGNLVVLESTSPVGTTERLVEWLARERPDLRFPRAGTEDADINVAYCPERVLPGHVVRELVENDRTVGGLTPSCSAKAVALYRIFVHGQLLVTDARTAEMCKLTENAFRDVNIAFANELSVICDRMGINVWELIRFANHHPRVNILQPGPGVGGHCIAVDPWFIVSAAPDESPLIRTAREVNDAKPGWVLDKAAAAMDTAGPDARMACLGLTFKADIDDLRESPALTIAESLAKRYPHRVLVVEPNVTALPAGLSEASARKASLAEALAECDVIVILVDHKDFKLLEKGDLAGKRLVDTRGLSAASR